MRIAILLFDRFTALDAVGPYEVLSRVGEVTFVGTERGQVRTDNGVLGMYADAALHELTDPDVLVVPGGPGQTALMDDGAVHEWLRAVDRACTWTTAVCTGSLVLAAAGLLEGRRANTLWHAREQLSRYGATPVADRVVFDGKYVTAAGVSAGIDMGLALAERLTDTATAQAVQLGIEYDPHPPLDAGSPDKAPAAIVERLRSRSRFTRSGEA